MTDKEKSILQKEIVDSLDPRPHGRLLLAPRVGKSRIMVNLIKRDCYDSILWVTPSAELADMSNYQDGIVSEFVKWRAKKYIRGLTTVTWASLNKVTGPFGLIVLDEEQYITENTVEILMDGTLTAGTILSMTGTPTKHVDKKAIYEDLKLDVLYEIDINEAVDIGLLSNYVLNVLEVEMGNKKTIMAGNKDKQFMVSEAAQYAYLDSVMKKAMYQKRKDLTFRIMARRRAIADSPSKHAAAKFLFENLEGRVMMFCGSIDQAERLSEHTYHSKTDNTHLLAFKRGELDKLCLVDAGGTGHTYREVDHLVVVQTDSDKNGRTSQKISRTLLQQPDYRATIWILCLAGTQDSKWVESTLENFDKTKVKYLKFKDLPETLKTVVP